jgi:hypothetical protein
MPKQKVNVKPNDGEDAISDALSKIKNGSIKVGEMPAEIRKEIMNES